MTSNIFQQFLIDWGVKHRLSSPEYPNSNGRAEFGVKATKRTLYNNISSSTGSINNYKVARAILQYRNTPLPNIHLSPVQILFHCQLWDHIPSHPSHYHYHQGCKFNCQWLKTGITFEVLLNRQYKICMHGSSHIILQNRWFIQKLSTPTPTIYVSPTNTLIPKSIIPTKLDGTTYRPQHHCH